MPCIHNEMSAAALLGVRHLLRPDRGELRGRHARSGKDARFLHFGVGGNHHHRVAPAVAARLEEEGHIEHDQGTAFRDRPTEEGYLLFTDERMNDGFQPPHRMRPPHDALRQLCPVHGAVHDGARKGFFDERRRPAAIERVDGNIRIVNRNAEEAKHGCGRRLSHPDRAGQAEKKGHGVRRTSASIRARNSPVTSGLAPYQRSKPGTAWWSSMPSPSTARSPRARAERSSSVSRGA